MRVSTSRAAMRNAVYMASDKQRFHNQVRMTMYRAMEEVRDKAIQLSSTLTRSSGDEVSRIIKRLNPYARKGKWGGGGGKSARSGGGIAAALRANKHFIHVVSGNWLRGFSGPMKNIAVEIQGNTVTGYVLNSATVNGEFLARIFREGTHMGDGGGMLPRLEKLKKFAERITREHFDKMMAPMGAMASAMKSGGVV